METIPSNKVKTLDWLINQIDESAHDLTIPKCGIFLGAGCSISSGIRSGWGIVELCQRLSFIKEQPSGRKILNNGQIDEFINKNQSEFVSFIEEKHKEFLAQVEAEKKIYLETIPKDISKNFENENLLWEEYRYKFFQSSLYGKWFETYTENPIDRQKLIEKEIEFAKPSGEYLILAYLIELGRFNNIFTTNFDDLVNDALIEFIGKKSRIYAHNEIANFIDIYSKRPNIIKLHGDYLFQNIKNTENETLSLFNNMKVKLREALLKTDLIVIGYGGSDYSVMDALLKIKEEHPFGLYWCSLNIEKENWRVKHLITSTKNSFFVPIEGFENFTHRLYEEYQTEIQPYPLADKIEPYKNTVNETLERLNNSIILNTLVEEDPDDRYLPNKKIEKFLALPNYEERIQKLITLELPQLGNMLYYLHLKSPKYSNSYLKELVKRNLLLEKIIELSIPKISSFLTKLLFINSSIAHDFIEENQDIFFNKLKNASVEDKITSENELKKVNSVVISEIMGRIKYSEGDYKVSELKYYERLVIKDDFYENYDEDEIIEKMSHSQLALIKVLLSKLNIEKSKPLLEKIESTFLKEKLEEAPLHVIGQTMTIFRNIDSFIAKKVFRNTSSIILQKIQITDIDNIAEALVCLFKVDKVFTKKIFAEIDIQLLKRNLQKCPFEKIPYILSRISIIDMSKAYLLYNDIDSDLIVSKIEKDVFEIRMLNEIGSKLKKVDEEKTKLIFDKVNLANREQIFGRQASKLTPRAFLQFMKEFSNLSFANTCKISRYIDKNYLIQKVLLSDDLTAYMRFTPTLLRIFDFNSNQTEAAIFLSKYMNTNFTLLENMVGTEVAKETKIMMRKYIQD